MRTSEDLDAFANRPEVAELDLSAFSSADIVNTVLQRTEVLFDQPRRRRLIRAWTGGDDAPLRAAVDERGEVFLRRAIGALFAEYLELKPLLERLAPKKVADIGCGYAFFDLFLARDFDAKLVLIDLEESDARHFGISEEGAAYASLAVAKAFLRANGVPARSIRTLNPRENDPEKLKDVDLALSLLSCGFHYPVSTYEAFFRDTVLPEGAIILDLRNARGVWRQRAVLEEIGRVTTLSDEGKASRLLVEKAHSDAGEGAAP
jgi:SAM-dependent methyltransferase